MGKEKTKVTQKALELIKKHYRVIKVDGSIVGWCHERYLEKLKHLDKKEIKPKLGFGGEFSEKPGLEWCFYNAKNPDKVHIGYTSRIPEGKTEDERSGIVRGIPDERIVLMTEDEADAFKKEAKKHKKFPPDNSYIDTTSPEMRKVIPKGKHLIQNGVEESLANLGVPVVEI